MKNVHTSIMFCLSLLTGLQLNGFFGIHQVSKPAAIAVSNQVSVLVAALGIHSQRKQSSDYSQYSYESFLQHGFSEEKARWRAWLAEQSKETQENLFKSESPDTVEITNSSLIQVVDSIRKHKNIEIPVMLFYRDIHSDDTVATNQYVGSVASTYIGCTKFPVIVLSSLFYNLNNSQKIQVLFHECQHLLQTNRDPNAYLGDDPVEREKDAEHHAYQAMGCCACLEDVVASGVTTDNLEPKGYFGQARIKAIIAQREAADQHGTCVGHKKIFSGKGSVVELKDFLPSEVKR